MSQLMLEKQNQFNDAMEKYDKKAIYKFIGETVSFVIILLQFVLAYLVFQKSIGIWMQILTFVMAVILADFINGLVHMYMDNNSNYTSIVGPFIAGFHLHHRTPVYKKKPLLMVYYNESGSKIWLAAFLLLAVPSVLMGMLNDILSYGVLYFAILSSIAEVSHYLCHGSRTKTHRFLASIWILLPIKHHMRHHRENNINYAFLNGLTDSLINRIAKIMYPGYKNTTDKHYAHYHGPETENRI